MKTNIIVMIKQPRSWPIIKTIPNNHKTLQDIVEGHFEVVDVRKNAMIVCNEDAKRLTKFHNKKNFSLTVDGHVIDEIYGTAIFLSQDGEDFDDLAVPYVLDFFTSLCEDNPKLEVDFR